jgi:protein-tyrosine phosphatase
MAESVVRRRAADAGLAHVLELDSAGIGGWHVGEGADRGAVRGLRRRGYDCGGHVARRFETDWFHRRDLLIPLDRGHERGLRALVPDLGAASRIRLLRTFDATARSDLDIPDPYDGGAGDFDYCLDLIEAACPGLLAHIREHFGPDRQATVPWPAPAPKGSPASGPEAGSPSGHAPPEPMSGLGSWSTSRIGTGSPLRPGSRSASRHGPGSA